MHDQARIALDARHIGVVVVDAMAVEGERRIAEQQHRIGMIFFDQVASVGAGLGGRAVSPGLAASR